MAALTEGTVVVGTAAIVSLNGTPVGYASGVTISVAIQNNRVNVMGNPFSREIKGGNVSVSVSVNKFLIYRDSAIQQGFFPESTPNGQWTSPYLDIDIVDADDSSPVFGAHRCKPQTLNVAVDQTGIMGENLTFDATYYKDNRPLAEAV